MQVLQAALGPFGTNCFYFRFQDHGYLVDPGDETVARFLEKTGPVDVVLLTHGHVDHLLGISAVRKKYPEAKVVLAKADLSWYGQAELQAAMFGLRFSPVPDPDVLLEAPCEFEGIQVLATPGHTPGGVCYHLPEHGIVFAGDTLFERSIGRTDFPGGSMPQLRDSIRNVLYTLSPSTLVYTGHGPETTIGDEMRDNPFVPAKRP